MHQILADHDKQISIQHLRERSTERSCDVNRNEVAYFADVIKQVFGSSTQVPIRLWDPIDWNDRERVEVVLVVYHNHSSTKLQWSEKVLKSILSIKLPNSLDINIMTIQKGVLTISKELFCQRPFGQTLYNQKADGLMMIISSRSPSLLLPCCWCRWCLYTMGTLCLCCNLTRLRHGCYWIALGGFWVTKA